MKVKVTNSTFTSLFLNLVSDCKCENVFATIILCKIDVLILIHPALL